MLFCHKLELIILLQQHTVLTLAVTLCLVSTSLYVTNYLYLGCTCHKLKMSQYTYTIYSCTTHVARRNCDSSLA